jgi:hypothetical protein
LQGIYSQAPPAVGERKKKVVTTNNHKSFNFWLQFEQQWGVEGEGTDLYLYHNDSNFGLRVLHRSYNKAHIGC